MKQGTGKLLTLELLRSKCRVDSNTGCWNFIGDKAQRYPRINFEGLCIKASHAALALKLGRKLKDGMCALHSCDNPRCANPQHLREGTHVENKADAMARQRCSGWALSETTRARQSLARLGKPLSEAAKCKLKEYWRGRREPT